MIQGYILSFHPARRSGTLVTESGEAIPFLISTTDQELHGGDVVLFELEPVPHPVALGVPRRLVDWELVGSGSDQFAAFRNPLVKEYYRTVDLDRTGRSRSGH